MKITLADIEDDAVYTPKQIAGALQAKPRRIAQAFRDGELAGIELGPRTIRITGRAVKEWLARKKLPLNSADSDNRAETIPMDNGAFTSSVPEKPVKDIVLRSL